MGRFELDVPHEPRCETMLYVRNQDRSEALPSGRRVRGSGPALSRIRGHYCRLVVLLVAIKNCRGAQAASVRPSKGASGIRYFSYAIVAVHLIIESAFPSVLESEFCEGKDLDVCGWKRRSVDE
jgi:hypothetical protein